TDYSFTFSACIRTLNKKLLKQLITSEKFSLYQRLLKTNTRFYHGKSFYDLQQKFINEALLANDFIIFTMVREFLEITISEKMLSGNLNDLIYVENHYDDAEECANEPLIINDKEFEIFGASDCEDNFVEKKKIKNIPQKTMVTNEWIFVHKKTNLAYILDTSKTFVPFHDAIGSAKFLYDAGKNDGNFTTLVNKFSWKLNEKELKILKKKAEDYVLFIDKFFDDIL